MYAITLRSISANQVMETYSMLANLHMEAVHIKKLFSINWLCEFGLVENVELVVEEYRRARGLLVGTEVNTGKCF